MLSKGLMRYGCGINKIPIFEKGWLCQPFSKIGILFSCKSLSSKTRIMGVAKNFDERRVNTPQISNLRRFLSAIFS